jgi:hypothetical protein
MSSDKSKEQTSMRHARAICNARWPSSPTVEAQKSVTWIPVDPYDPSRGRRPISKPEDVFGVFDLVVLRSWVHGGTDLCIQVTTSNRGDTNATKRKRKIETAFLDLYYDQKPGEKLLMGVPPDIWVWAWVARKHFRGWEWLWEESSWSERREIESPGFGESDAALEKISRFADQPLF